MDIEPNDTSTMSTC
ncbi:hypothetical protein CISIN_1g0332202mg, partial [Citrus sinensis]